MKPVYTIIFSLLLLACSSSKPVEKPKAISQPEEDERKAQSLKIEFHNQSGKVVYIVDPTDEDLFIDFKGKAKSVFIQDTIYQKDQNPQKQQMQKEAEQNASEPWVPVDSLREKIKPQEKQAEVDTVKKDVLQALSKAREAFYKKKYKEAIENAERSLTFQETAEAYALLGSIHFTRKQRKKAIENWNRALEIDPELQSVKDILKKLEGGKL